ncbi:exfoliative toxin A/B [Streptococcus henryi]|uniref:Exfoliative toxin A/B n=1 Tax=Streptococcus henryi TaxID=439219 RepID=A0A1G6B8Q7_9STRE|nr:TDT family transporter [Streptococcus henryi]SDB16994.1 exfoliative toxin A/B [Streptococcus henryi]
MKLFKQPPLAMSGLILAQLALGQLLIPFLPFLSLLIAYLGLLEFIYLTVFIVSHPKTLARQLEKALPASIFSTYFMSSLLLAVNFQSWNLTVAPYFWWFGTIGHILHLLYFTGKFVFRFNWDNVYPSWTVLFIGLSLSALTSGITNQVQLGMAIFWFCLCLSLPLFILIVYKLRQFGIDQVAQPNLATLCAPLSLLLATYQTISPSRNLVLSLILLVVSQSLYFYILRKIPNLFHQSFHPGFSALTFPLVISARALFITCSNLGLNQIVWQSLIYLEVAIASFIVIYVTIGYIGLFRTPFSNG